MKTPDSLLTYLNTTYVKLHKSYEDYYWDSYMGNADVSEKKDIALTKLDAFRSDKKLREKINELKLVASKKEVERLDIWARFFDLYQMPAEAMQLRSDISTLETKIQTDRAIRVEGYIDPVTKSFVAASTVRMRSMIQTHDDERVRKACYVAREELATRNVDDFVVLVALRNRFAHLLGYADFYDYKLRHIDQMTKDELFGLFGDIRTALAPVFTEIRQAEKSMPGLRRPWNFLYKQTGDYTKVEEPYYQFGEAIPRWLASFSRLGVSFGYGTLTLDLLDRAGKYNNGFCHWPDLVQYRDNKRLPGSANFTCVVVPGQVGSTKDGYKTLFHEGGHAAHFLSVTEREVCLNHEYMPMTAAWAETQSMFMDTLLDSYEWKVRYAKDVAGEAYSHELFVQKREATRLLRHTRIMPIIFIAEFERAIYECKNLSSAKVLLIARHAYGEHYDQTEASLQALNTPHIYSWESACSYHGYGLAEVALHMWREYFYKKYGYIVDNKQIGKEMTKVWNYGSRYDFNTMVKLATDKKLSAQALIRYINEPTRSYILKAKKYLKATPPQRPISEAGLKGNFRLAHGKKVVANSTQGLSLMYKKYQVWLSLR